MSPNEIETNPEDDPVEIAVRTFNGTESSRKLWRRYLHALYEKYGDIAEAQSFFAECIYTAQSEIKNDKIPDWTPPSGRHAETDHIHAKHFTNCLKYFIPTKGQK